VADSQTDIRDRILAWLDDPPTSNLHGDLCPTWLANGGTSDEGCDCDHGKLRRAVRAAVELHERIHILPGADDFNDAHLTSEPMPICKSCTPEKMFRRTESWPCRTIRAVADALGATP